MRVREAFAEERKRRLFPMVIGDWEEKSRMMAELVLMDSTFPDSSMERYRMYLVPSVAREIGLV